MNLQYIVAISLELAHRKKFKKYYNVDNNIETDLMKICQQSYLVRLA